LRAFWAERALPSGVFGPRDLAPFLRLAAARAGERQMSMEVSLNGGGRPGDQPATSVYLIIGITARNGLRALRYRGVCSFGDEERTAELRGAGCGLQPLAAPTARGVVGADSALRRPARGRGAGSWHKPAAAAGVRS
jgi:hypothetical protein